MRITKNIKDYFEKELNESFNQKKKAIYADYNQTRELAEKTILPLYTKFCSDVQKILVNDFNMSEEIKKYGSLTKISELVVPFAPQFIENQEIEEELREKVRRLSVKKNELLSRFYLECDLGVDKEEFFKMVEQFKKEFENE